MNALDYIVAKKDLATVALALLSAVLSASTFYNSFIRTSHKLTVTYQSPAEGLPQVGPITSSHFMAKIPVILLNGGNVSEVMLGARLWIGKKAADNSLNGVFSERSPSQVVKPGDATAFALELPDVVVRDYLRREKEADLILEISSLLPSGMPITKNQILYRASFIEFQGAANLIWRISGDPKPFSAFP